MLQNMTDITYLFDTAKAFVAAVSAVFQIGLIIFCVKWAFKAGKTEERIVNWANKLTDNHLAHIQAATEKSAEMLSELQTAMKLHDNNESAHHAEQLRVLGDIKGNGCDRRCTKH